MTLEEKRQFEKQWPAVAARLGRLLARRRVPAEKRDDIVQETGLRLLHAWNKVDAARPLWPFTLTIALNLMRDEQRRSSTGGEVPCAVPDHEDRVNVEETAVARLELRRAGRALALLRSGHRDALLAEVEPSLFVAPTGTPAARKMLRMRARRRLTALMQQVSALGAVTVAPIRRLTRSGHLVPYGTMADGLAPAACGVILCALVVGGASLGAFSGLPGSRADTLERDGGLIASETFAEGAGGGHAHARGLLVAGTEAFRAGSRISSDAWDGKEGGDAQSSEHDDSLSQERSYEIPLGHGTLARGTVTVEVYHGGQAGSAPSVPSGTRSIDCSGPKVSPNEVDLRCSSADGSGKKYGARVHHEGETALDGVSS
jgi:hypothetical protein